MARTAHVGSVLKTTEADGVIVQWSVAWKCRARGRRVVSAAHQGLREAWNVMECVADDESVSAVRVFTDGSAELLEGLAVSRGFCWLGIRFFALFDR